MGFACSRKRMMYVTTECIPVPRRRRCTAPIVACVSVHSLGEEQVSPTSKRRYTAVSGRCLPVGSTSQLGLMESDMYYCTQAVVSLSACGFFSSHYYTEKNMLLRISLTRFGIHRLFSDDLGGWFQRNLVTLQAWTVYDTSSH